MWSVDALDWQTGATSFDVISRVMGRTSDGALVLMHVGSTATPPALTEIITRVREEGSAFVSLESLVSGNDTAS
jgi:peptidoglycan/xylan/chitin deacetylase (PgdA/CDA1 family)